MTGKLKFNFEPIEAWRKINDYTYERTAEALGISGAYLSNLKDGHRVPSLDMLEEMVNVTGIEVGRLLIFDRETDPTPPKKKGDE